MTGWAVLGALGATLTAIGAWAEWRARAGMPRKRSPGPLRSPEYPTPAPPGGRHYVTMEKEHP